MAYLKNREAPRFAGRPFGLGAIVESTDRMRRRVLLRDHGRRVVDPHRIGGSPANYTRYTCGSRAAFVCAKPIHESVRRGGGACPASGRTVLAQGADFSEGLPVGRGWFASRDTRDAVVGVADIDRKYGGHQRAPRQLAEACLDSRRCLAALSAAGEG